MNSSFVRIAAAVCGTPAAPVGHSKTMGPSALIFDRSSGFVSARSFATIEKEPGRKGIGTPSFFSCSLASCVALARYLGLRAVAPNCPEGRWPRAGNLCALLQLGATGKSLADQPSAFCTYRLAGCIVQPRALGVCITVEPAACRISFQQQAGRDGSCLLSTAFSLSFKLSEDAGIPAHNASAALQQPFTRRAQRSWVSGFDSHGPGAQGQV